MAWADAEVLRFSSEKIQHLYLDKGHMVQIDTPLMAEQVIIPLFYCG